MLSDIFLKSALEQYKRNCLEEGDTLEDIMDKLNEIVSEKIDQWCDENPINL